MWEVLFTFSFLVNIALLIYFLRPPVPEVFKKPEPFRVRGFEATEYVRLKDPKPDFSDVFDTSKGWRNSIGF